MVLHAHCSRRADKPPRIYAYDSTHNSARNRQGATLRGMKYKGVEERDEWWAAFYDHGDQKTHLGLYATEEIAAGIHDLAVI